VDQYAWLPNLRTFLFLIYVCATSEEIKSDDEGSDHDSFSVQLCSSPKTGPCPEHNHHTRQGLFKWPQVGVQRITSLPCTGNPEKTAYREW